MLGNDLTMPRFQLPADTGTANPITGEHCRGFLVFFAKGKRRTIADVARTLCYERRDTLGSHRPYFSGEEALDVMRTLHGRGFDALAYTATHRNREGWPLRT